MPYESFKCQHQLSIRGLVQDPATGSWRFLLHVKRSMQGHSQPHVYAIRRSYADFKRLHGAISPAVAVLPELPIDSLFSFFVGETQTVLQKKRVVLEAILKAIESHPQASEAAPFLEFLANTENYEQYSEAPPSPVGSLKEFNASFDVHKAAPAPRLHASPAQVFQQPGAATTELLRRRNSTLLLPLRTTPTNEPLVSAHGKRGSVPERPRRHTVDAEVENRVDFSRYSQM